MTGLLLAAHYSAPWYIAIPIVVVVLGLRLLVWRRRRRWRGPFSGGRGPFFGGSGT